jgi:hypothetical protein
MNSASSTGNRSHAADSGTARVLRRDHSRGQMTNSSKAVWVMFSPM